MMTESRLVRSDTDRIIAGVCGGLATYLGIDVVLVRLAFAVLLFASGIGFPIYMVMWIVMPLEADANQTNSEVIHKNIDEMGTAVASGMNRIGKPGTIGVILIMLGAYFLLQQFGGLGWISNAIFWPLFIIGIGVFVMSQRK